jgi:hypothetical protein
MPMLEPEMVTMSIAACIIAAVLLAFAMVGCPVRERRSDEVIMVSAAPESTSKSAAAKAAEPGV